MSQRSIHLAVDVRCLLGEGPLWHPLRQSLLFTDIERQVIWEATFTDDFLTSGKLTTLPATAAFGFDCQVSALGWLDEDSVIVSSARGLHRLNLAESRWDDLASLEADNAATRSNDGRVDRAGGFWVSTMSNTNGRTSFAEGIGTIYRFHRGRRETLYTGLTSPNAICFSPAGDVAYFCDTTKNCIRRVRTDPATGAWQGESQVFIETEEAGFCPDGAVVDAAGSLWVARWGEGCLSRFGPDGTWQETVSVPVSHPTCPAFGGPELRHLFITSARCDLSPNQLAAQPLAGAVLMVELDTPGLPEPRCRAFDKAS